MGYSGSMGLHLHELGRAGVAVGWRKKVADRVAEPVAARTQLSKGDIRMTLGLVFLALSGYYLIGTLRRALR